MTKKCVICGNDFSATGNAWKSKTCSEPCRQAAKQQYESNYRKTYKPKIDKSRREYQRLWQAALRRKEKMQKYTDCLSAWLSEDTDGFWVRWMSIEGKEEWSERLKPISEAYQKLASVDSAACMAERV